MRFFGVLVGLLALVSGCDCGRGVNKILPSLGVSPVGLDFGKVKIGGTATRALQLQARTQTNVTLSKVAIEGAGASAFSLGSTPTQIDPLGEATVQITFRPTALEASTATLVIASNDPDRPTTRVALAGEGAHPIIEVTPTCDTSLNCRGAVTATTIDFGEEPLERAVPLPTTSLPTVVVVNAGDVLLHVSKAAIEGADAAAFTFEGTFPAEGLDLDPMAGFNLALRFVPTSEQQASYQAQLVIESDDPDRPRITIELSGTLRANLSPIVCANLVRVVPPVAGDLPRDYSTAADWNLVRTPPAQGYDFTTTRDVRPGELVTFSASSPGEADACSYDPEDQRMGLVYSWQVTLLPSATRPLVLTGATTSQVQLRPVVTGEYGLRLTVADRQGHSTSVDLRFAVAAKADLVAQLQWTGYEGVDLDLHLVRPSAVTTSAPFDGAFDFFTHGAGFTSGDINGFSELARQNWTPANFDWGLSGSADDPKLNLDDKGAGELVENISLNYPENDPACATASCRYKIFVHYFEDKRMHTPPGCFVDGGVDCRDGEACGCASGDRCVADGAPIGDAGVGSGKCYPPPKPVVRLFFRANPTPASVIPLDTLMPPDELVLGAPCEMLYVADVEWPAKSAIGSLPDGGTPPAQVFVIGADGGRIVEPAIARFGWRETGGSLRCTPDLPVGVGPSDWYSEQPR